MAPPTKKNMMMNDLFVNNFFTLGKYLAGKNIILFDKKKFKAKDAVTAIIQMGGWILRNG